MLVNKTKDKVLTAHVQHCKGIFSKARGLMFSRKIKDKSLVFHFNKEKLNPIHMLFVFQTIDVLFLDKERKIIEKKESLRPWRFYNPKERSRYIIELPENTIKTSETEVNDTIIWGR